MSLTVGLETAALILGKGRKGREAGKDGERLGGCGRGAVEERGDELGEDVADAGLRGECLTGLWVIDNGESAEGIARGVVGGSRGLD